MTSTCTICSKGSETWRYGGLACNACATFFNRNVVKNRQINCDSSGLLNNRNCYDKSHCRSCRLSMCYAVGMKKEIILNNIERRKTSIAQKSVVKLEMKVEEDDMKQIVLYNPNLPEIVIDRVILNMRKVEDAFNTMRFSKFNPLTTSVTSLDDALEGFSKLSIEYGEMPGWPLEYTKGYTDADGSFEENIKKRIVAGLDTEKFTGNRKSWYFCNIVFAIEYFKSFDVFYRLSSKTKRILAGKMALLCANFSNYYFSMRSKINLKEKEAIMFPDGTGPFEGMETVFPKQYEAAVSCIKKLRAMNLDENEYVLMKVLLVLSPSLDGASDSERALLTSHSESYAKILFSYVIARRGRHGPRMYQEMLSCINMINHRTKLERDIQVYLGALGWFREHQCPLLEEIVML
ncbi:hypothetical protein PRIPAC_79302 [Pristionchus pacificus]|uniref:Nuclear receptor n=1 Tax=Pristionchus pacificus TaxID=54126 RepID=A0A2A6C265_PRIPA|nr:hypothetical protein PRIPAC_79302 [Pristionchus pacificus]|eukprot:PDM72199.1 nuclear receptor [Pristionchus pacificus]